MALIKLENVSKYYKSGEGVSVGMQKVSLSFDAGEFVAIIGESGSGKSTLLNVISGLDTYEDGEVYLNDEETSHYTIKDWESYRAKYIGFIFQSYNIIDSYTVFQNVMLALEVQNYPKHLRKKRALELIDKVGLTSHKHHKAAKLSGGQKQRAVIARALAKDCPIIACDEPTGNLDSESSKQIIELLHEISKDKLIIIVTHNFDEVKQYATRKIKIHDGEVVEDKVLKRDVEIVKVEEPKTSKMTVGSVARFAIRNIFSIPRRFLLFLFLQLAIMVLFTNIFASFMRTANSFNPFDLFIGGDSINSVYKDHFSDNRFLILRQDNQPLSEADYEAISSVSGDFALYKDAFELDFASNYTFIFGGSYYGNAFFDSVYTIKDNPSLLIDGTLNLAANEIVVSNAFTEAVVGQNLEVSSFEYSTHNTVLTNITSDLLNYDAKLYDSYVELEINTDLKFYYSFASKDFPISLSSFDINYQDVTSIIVREYGRHEGKTYKVVGIYNDNFSEKIYFSEAALAVENIGSGFMLVAKNKSDATRIFNRIDKSVYRVIYPELELGELASITEPIKLVVKVFFYALAFAIGIFLYFLLATVTKNIMHSRMKDFAIYRSIGANQQKLALLVIFEQLFLMLIAFTLSMLILFYITRVDYSIYLTFSYLSRMDYVVLFALFAILTFRLASKFNNKTFKISVIENISESKEMGL
ncbi:ABC transporter ATP-binding protein/permease [Acholeplasma hippikon]|nr:ABC transporter ATP-binding protein/permease [Acholeplasma hippikon]